MRCSETKVEEPFRAHNNPLRSACLSRFFSEVHTGRCDAALPGIAAVSRCASEPALETSCLRGTLERIKRTRRHHPEHMTHQDQRLPPPPAPGNYRHLRGCCSRRRRTYLAAARRKLAYHEASMRAATAETAHIHYALTSGNAKVTPLPMSPTLDHVCRTRLQRQMTRYDPITQRHENGDTRTQSESNRSWGNKNAL